MARTKQTAVKRESSSEFFNKQSAAWEDSNGKEAKATNGHAASATAAQEAATGEAGIVQLVIAVSGIYASL
jgi:UDP-galactose transporter B1